MANDSSSFPRSLLIPFAAGGCSDDDDGYDEGPSTPSPSPPSGRQFPAILSDSDSDVALFPPPPSHVDHCPAPQGAASAFFGLGFREEDDHDGGEWAPPGEVELPLCWDCLQLEEPDHQRWDIGVNGGGGDEWEQVGIRVEEEEEEAAAAVRSLEWEVLLATNSLGSLVVDGADYDGGIDTFFLDDADDVLFGQLAAEHEPPAAKGARAAAKAARRRASRPWSSTRPAATRSARCARTAWRPASGPGGCPARTFTTTAASCRGSPSAKRARCAAMSCPPMTPSTRTGRRGEQPPAAMAMATGTASLGNFQ
ncbi:hypothetical protein OsJ_08214 [Oryza sativa Japonica Group]|uniref:Uncharacterized protein n=1 Tax=Oryza sativa subsp. japonica TaxID=39947 RepID=A3AAX6_ORYSJ|nr:hypothetical protein OsJ_08214 [Oryza sativa Japonica Group]